MQLLVSAGQQRTSLLRTDITQDLRRQRNGGGGGGGDFHSPFWADAKAHVEGSGNLRVMHQNRIEDEPRRQRLYPLLTEGFLGWWEDRRRRRNEPFDVIDDRIFGRIDVPDLGVVKVENNLAFNIGDDDRRIIYPYFSETPELTVEVARLGLWVMARALPRYTINEMRILDVLRGVSFSTVECPQQGNEEELFRQTYRALSERWHELRLEYPPYR